MGVGDGLGQVARRSVILKGNDDPSTNFFAPLFAEAASASIQSQSFFSNNDAFAPFVASSSISFSDVSTSHWAYAAIYNLVDHGAVSGFSDGTFRPNAATTIEQFIAVVLRTANVPLPPETTPWSDRYINYAVANGLLLPTAYRGDNITREFAFFFMYSVLGGSDNGVRNRIMYYAPQTTATMAFSDNDQITDRYRDAIQGLFQHSIVEGHISGEVRPADTLSRAEMAKVLFRALTTPGDLVSTPPEPFHPDLISQFADVFLGETGTDLNAHGTQAFQFTPAQTEYYMFHTSNYFTPLVFSIWEDGDETHFSPINNLLPPIGEGETRTLHHLESGQTVIVVTSGEARQYLILTIGIESAIQGEFHIPEDAEWLVHYNEDFSTMLYVTESAVATFGPFTDVYIGVSRYMRQNDGSIGEVFVFYNDEWKYIGRLVFMWEEIQPLDAGIQPAILPAPELNFINPVQILREALESFLRSTPTDPSENYVMGSFNHRHDELFVIQQGTLWQAFVDEFSDTILFVTAGYVSEFGRYRNVRVGISRLFGSAGGHVYVSRGRDSRGIYIWERATFIRFDNHRDIDRYSLSRYEINPMILFDRLGYHALDGFLWHVLGEQIINNPELYDFQRAEGFVIETLVALELINHVEFIMGYYERQNEMIWGTVIDFLRQDPFELIHGAITGVINLPADIIELTVVIAEAIADGITPDEIIEMLDTYIHHLSQEWFEDTNWVLNNIDMFDLNNFHRLSHTQAREMGRHTGGMVTEYAIALAASYGVYKTASAAIASITMKIKAAIRVMGPLRPARNFLNPRSTNLTWSSAENANAQIRLKGYTEPPFVPGTQVITATLTQETRFVRVFGANSTQVGSWIMRADDVAGLTARQIQSKFALQHTPTHITDVIVPSGTQIRASMVNPLFGQSGGGIQFDLFLNPTYIPRDNFLNARPLIQ